ncbi:unnamed protein product [Medioppia subpectinata]|uniref:Carboxylic ester hydrolase n=1 Tax=Medioppia subpectinata TaxID=1979941 RepID=A0A7R9KZ28_9ACAR|nr:unnamed protein product [Medioppia subpectinata]CAG2112292.1 unnamed protein product [Medioppia subpectinata]
MVLFVGFAVVFGDNTGADNTDNDQTVSVRIKNGIINGLRETTVDGRELNVYRGIPYAEPPVGDLRFRKPLPRNQWSEPLNAFNYSKACYQSIGFVKSQQNWSDDDFGEDCLYLNIWSPVTADDESPKAVMFWIHGGALMVGSAHENHYEGHVLSGLGDVVFVSVNYRVFGFLYSGTPEAPGNMGLWDQALALEWVNDNIRYFGGDPERITIFGESAGSWAASLHVLSPVSRHLFHNAILSSGAYTNNLIDAPNDAYIEMWLLGAELSGCGTNETQFTEEVMQCMRALDVDKLADIVSMPQLNSREISLFFVVVVDGEFLPKMPAEMLADGDYKRNVNLMVSNVEDEGSFILQMMYRFRYFHATNPYNYTYAEAVDELTLIAPKLSIAYEINGEEVAKLYYTGLSDANDYHLLRRTMGIAVGDYYFTCPTVEFAHQVFRHSDFKANVYQYVFNSKLRDNFLCSKWMGVCHGNDLAPMFGRPLADTDQYSDREVQISRQMVDFLTEFAKTGAPSAQNGTHWQKYFAIDDNIVAPFYEITIEPKAVTNFGVGFKMHECQHLWRKYLIS